MQHTLYAVSCALDTDTEGGELPQEFVSVLQGVVHLCGCGHIFCGISSPCPAERGGKATVLRPPELRQREREGLSGMLKGSA